MNLLQIHRFDQWSSLFLQKSMIILEVESLSLSSKTSFFFKIYMILTKSLLMEDGLESIKNGSLINSSTIDPKSQKSWSWSINVDFDQTIRSLIKVWQFDLLLQNHQSYSLSSKSKSLSNFDQQCQLWSKSSKSSFFHFYLTFFTQVICRCWNHQQSIYSDFSSLLQLLPTFWRNRVLLRILMIFDEVITFLKTLIRTQNSSLSLKERTLKIWTSNHQRIALSHFERSNLQSFTLWTLTQSLEFSCSSPTFDSFPQILVTESKVLSQLQKSLLSSLVSKSLPERWKSYFHVKAS